MTYQGRSLIGHTRIQNWLIQTTLPFTSLLLSIATGLDGRINLAFHLANNEHIQAQAQSLAALQAIGYKAEFGLGYDDCIQLIENYLKLFT